MTFRVLKGDNVMKRKISLVTAMMIVVITVVNCFSLSAGALNFDTGVDLYSESVYMYNMDTGEDLRCGS